MKKGACAETARKERQAFATAYTSPSIKIIEKPLFTELHGDATFRFATDRRKKWGSLSIQKGITIASSKKKAGERINQPFARPFQQQAVLFRDSSSRLPYSSWFITFIHTIPLRKRPGRLLSLNTQRTTHHNPTQEHQHNNSSYPSTHHLHLL